jgi:hypothetical protein
MLSAAAERFRRWVARDGPASPLIWFRVAFGAIWLVYDLSDLLGSGTAHIYDWLGTTPPTELVLLQLGLIACEVALVTGKPSGLAPAVALVAALLRAVEWHTYLGLNDFAYYAVTALILAHVRAEGGLLCIPSADARTPRWPRDVLVLEAAWIYFATALLKANPTWLSGRHLFVRLEYLRAALDWPYPDVVNRCADSLRCDGALAALAVLSELTLACLLVLRPRRRLVAPLAIVIHGVGALVTNVWFFGPSLVAQVALLTD